MNEQINNRNKIKKTSITRMTFILGLNFEFIVIFLSWQLASFVVFIKNAFYWHYSRCCYQLDLLSLHWGLKSINAYLKNLHVKFEENSLTRSFILVTWMLSISVYWSSSFIVLLLFALLTWKISDSHLK